MTSGGGEPLISSSPSFGKVIFVPFFQPIKIKRVQEGPEHKMNESQIAIYRRKKQKQV
jgi:hypothetical protein